MDDDDIEAELAAARVVAAFLTRVQRLPLRRAFVDSLAHESGPAVHALLFALTTDRALDTNALEHHESTAMVALLGRSFALEGATPTAACGIVPALLDGFREAGFAVPPALDAPLLSVFVEGFVRGREEKLRADLGARALAHVVLSEILPKIGLVTIRGEHDCEQLGRHLESIARQAFALELSVCVVDVSVSCDPSDYEEPVLHFAELVASIGTGVIFVGPTAEAWATRLDGEACESLRAAVDRALVWARLIVRGDRAFVVPFRALFRGRAPRRA